MPSLALAGNASPLAGEITNGAADPLGAASINARVAAILTLTRELTGLLMKEMGMLKARRASALRETEAEKRRLSVLYAKEMRAIQMRPELLTGASAAQKEHLRTVAAEFKSCLSEHVRALARSRAVREALITAVGEELQRRSQPPSGYQRSSSPARLVTPASKPTAAAIALDRSI